MQVGVVIGRESVRIGQAVEVRHGRTADNVGIAGVFLDNNKNVAELRIGLAGSWSRRGNVCSRPASATRQREDETDESGNESKRFTLSPGVWKHMEFYRAGF